MATSEATSLRSARWFWLPLLGACLLLLLVVAAFSTTATGGGRNPSSASDLVSLVQPSRLLSSGSSSSSSDLGQGRSREKKGEGEGGGGQRSLAERPEEASEVGGAGLPRRGQQAGVLHLVTHRSAPKLNTRFEGDLKRLEEQADKVPLIQRRHIFHDLPAQFLTDPKWAKHLAMGRGRGFWFWKAAIVNLLLDNGTIADGDTMIWADGDIGTKGTRLGSQELWTKALSDIWSPEGMDFYIAHQGYCEFHWTKGDIFDKFGVDWNDPQYGLQNQPKANFWVMKVNAKTRRLIRMWEDLMSDFHLISDEPSVTPNPPPFRENRHDQSLLSMLLSASMFDRGACVRQAKHPVSKAPVLHPVYGIEGFRAKDGKMPDVIMHRR